MRPSPVKTRGRTPGTPGTPTTGDPLARIGGNWARTPSSTTLHRSGSSENARSPARRSPPPGMVGSAPYSLLSLCLFNPGRVPYSP
jgi:hypothetical protein